MSQKSLAVFLSKLEVFKQPKENLEQYATDSEVAAQALWHASMLGWIEDKEIIDLGAGTGVLGIGCIVLGAKKTIFIEVDKNPLEILKRNLIKSYEAGFEADYEIIQSDALTTDLKADLVVMNPPFGTREKGIDARFLENAFKTAPRIISFHKTVTSNFIEQISDKNNFFVKAKLDLDYPLKSTHDHHKKRIQRIGVTAWLLEKNS